MIVPALFALVLAQSPAEPLKRYEVEFTATVSGEHVLDKDPSLAELPMIASGSWWRGEYGAPVPYWNVVAYDKNGKSLGDQLDPAWTILVNPGSKRITGEFIASPDAARVELVMNVPDPKDTVKTSDAAIRPVKSPAVLNVNPSFTRGSSDYSGWGGAALREIRPDPANPGRHLLAVGGKFGGAGAWCEMVPLEPGKKYRVDWNLQRNTEVPMAGARVVFMLFKDHSRSPVRWEKSLQKVLMPGNTPKSGSFTFVSPENIVRMQGLFENVLVRNFAVTEERQ